MKRQKSIVLCVVLALLLLSATAYAQSVTPSQNGQGSDILDHLRFLPPPQAGGARSTNPGQRTGGGRGAAPVTDLGNVPADGVLFSGRNVRIDSGAWWTNTALVARLGLTDEQKAKIERAFENHRDKIVSCTLLLEKEEAQLARFLAAETIDRNAIFSQIDHVVQARGEMERVNAAMTLEMREALTRAQWLQLPQTAGGIYLTTAPAQGGRGRGTAQPAPESPPAPPAPPGRRGGGQRQQ